MPRDVPITPRSVQVGDDVPITPRTPRTPRSPRSPASRGSRRAALSTPSSFAQRPTRRGSSRLQADAPAGVVHAHAHGGGEPGDSMGAKFKAVQKEIHESVERAEVKLTAYEIRETERAEQLEIELDQMAGSEAVLTLAPEDVQDMVPAASKAVLYQIAEAHDESMVTLLKMYKNLEPAVLGDPVEPGPVDTFMDNFQDAQTLVDDVLAHRKLVENRVEAARQTYLRHQQEMHEQEMRQLEEMGIDADNPMTAGSADQTAAAGGTGAEASKLKALDENRRVLNARIKDLEAELGEEQQNYQIMEETKDELISHLKLQLEKSQEQMENILGATAHELADSAAAVEDTRLHIAYLTIQLRNARELADSRNFDVDKWVKRTDMEAVVKQANTLKVQVAKLADRVKSEQKNADEAHAYAKKCLRAKEKADLAHADWELKLRDTLKTRDSDLQGLQKETRLLHHRAEKLVHEMEETKARLEAEKHQAVEEAKSAAEEQRNAFNLILQERDATIQKLKADRQDLSDKLAAMTQVHQDHVAKIKREEEERLARQVDAQMLTDPIKIGGIGGLGGKGAEAFREAGMQTRSVDGILWKVLRRKFAIEAIGSLDRKTQKLAELDASLHALEQAMRAQWADSEATIKTVSQNIASVPRNVQRLQGVVSSVESFIAREEEALEKRSRLKTSIAHSMVQVRAGLQSALAPGVCEQISAERGGSREVDGDDDAGALDEAKKMLLEAKAEMGAFSSGGLDMEDQLVSLTSELRNLLDGETTQQIVAIRAGLVHEQQISQRIDLTHHKKCLTAITAGDFADDLPTHAGDSILSHPHHEESKALGDIIVEWNRQKTEWVKERLKLMQESNATRKELQNANFEILKGAGSENGSRPHTVETSRSATDEHAPHFGAQNSTRRADAAAYEMALNRSSSEDLEIEMEAVTRAIVKWSEQQANTNYTLVQPTVEDGITVPPLWSKCFDLVQAASIAFQHAQDAAAARPDSSYAQTDTLSDSRPVTADADADARWESLENDGEHGEASTEANANRDQATTQKPESMRKSSDQHSASIAHQSEHQGGIRKADAPHARKSGAKETHAPSTHEKRHHSTHSHSRGTERHSSKHRVSTAHSDASVGTEKMDLSMDARVRMMHSNNAAVEKIVKALKQMLTASRTPTTPQKTPASKALDAVHQQCAVCPGCHAREARRMAESTEAKDTPAKRDTELEGRDEVSTQHGAASDEQGLSSHDFAGDEGSQVDEASDAVQHPADKNASGNNAETPQADDAVEVSDSAAIDDELRVYEYDVSALETRLIAWNECGGEEEPPVEVCVHGHEHAVQDILELHQRRRSQWGISTLAIDARSSHALTPEDAATRLQTAARRKYGHSGPDFLGTVIVSQLRLRAELEGLAVSVAHHISELQQAQQDMQANLLQLVDEDNKLKEQYEELSGQVNDLQMKHEKLVNSHTRLSKDHKTAVDKLSETEKELVAARYRPPTKQTEVQTDQIEPEIVLVEQPPSQETLAEIAEKVRAELNDHIEKLKERNAYLERKDEAYMRMKEEVEDTQKRLETVATGTVAMASDLVDAREASIRNEEFAKALLEQQASTSENEMRMLEHHISVANAALEQISVPDRVLQKMEKSGAVPEGAATLSGAAAAHRAGAPDVASAGASAGENSRSRGDAVEAVAADPKKIHFKFQGEPCPTCHGNGIKPVPPAKPPTQTFELKKPSSAGRTISSPRALKKARTLHHAPRGGVPKLRSVGRSVILEDDDDEQDFATSAQRLLKLVDQDFADVAAMRDQMQSMFDIDSNKTPRSPRKKRSSGVMGVRHAGHPVSATSVKEADKHVLVATEKMAGLPSLFPPVVSSLRTPRGNPGPWTPCDPSR